MDAQELQKQLRLKLGSLTAALSPYSQYHDPQSYRLYAAVSFSALEARLPEAVRLTAQILTQTDFSDKTKLLELIRQQRDGLQQQIVNSGSSAAMLRASRRPERGQCLAPSAARASATIAGCGSWSRISTQGRTN